MQRGRRNGSSVLLSRSPLFRPFFRPTHHLVTARADTSEVFVDVLVAILPARSIYSARLDASIYDTRPVYPAGNIAITISEGGERVRTTHSR